MRKWFLGFSTMDFQNTIFEFGFGFEIQIILQSLTPTQEEINLINFGKKYGFVVLIISTKKC